ncbi:MAG: transposase IS605 [Mycoplasmataceae bacterium RV_VA103A]|nr:MAG: transposase IS605 [Mycoplasmataceae bacterium RV_VA103A]
MKRAFKYKLINLGKRNQSIIDKHLKICCWLHNYLLKHLRKKDKNGEKKIIEYQLVKLITEIKKERPFLKEVHSTTLQEIAKQVYKIWNHNEELKKLDSKKGYPNFKPLHRYNSLIYPQSIDKSSCGYKIDNSPLFKKRENRELKLTLGRQEKNVYLTVRIRMERSFQGNCKTLTIKRKNSKFYALFSCENIPLKILPLTGKKVGVDVNLEKKSYITLSNGKKYKHPNFYKKSEKGIKEASRNLSKKVEGSQNWKEAKLQLAKKWEKMVNQFKHEVHQITNELVRNYDEMAIENLKIRNMVRNRNLSKSIQQARWGILFKSIAEKTEIVARQFIRVNPHNTSQTCSNCNNLAEEKLELSNRTFYCQYCQFELDRDINSARNILNRAEGVWLKPSLEMGGEKLTASPIERGKYLLK